MPHPQEDLDHPRLAPTLRADLEAAGFTYDAVRELLGERAHAALGRNETTPAVALTGGGSPLETLVRLFLLQRPVAHGAARAALPEAAGVAVQAGLLERDGAQVRARLDCRPYAAQDADGAERDLWVVSDLTPGLDGAPVQVGADHVLGISPASTSLAQLTLRRPVGRALDLGTGCGVQALHLLGHAERVVATDVNRRALAVTRLNLALNAPGGRGEADGRVEVREGSLLDPVAGERFDLITTNPPFVVSPGREGADGGADLLVYRDSGLPGDRVVERIVREAPGHLADDGWLQVLGSWAVLDGVPWDERLAGWLPDTCDALVVQREVLDPAAYVELWLKDGGRHGGPGYAQRYDTWLHWLDDQGVTGIGFGWLNLHRSGRGGAPVRELLDHPWAVEQPVAPAVTAWGAAAGTRVAPGDRLRARADVVQETHGAPGAGDPETVVLRQQTGLRRARRVDTVQAALVGACDGDLTVGQILDALAELLELEPARVRAETLPAVADLVAQGFLLPHDDMA